MQTFPPMSSSFRQSYAERDQIEFERYEEDRRRRRGMAIAMVPLGIAMALIVQYTNIVVLLDDADWRYVLHRPNFAHVMKLSIAPILGGAFAMLFAVIIATSVAGREGRFFPPIMTVILYTVFLPVLVGLLLPANLFILDVTGLSFVELSVGEAFSGWIWSTPFFVATYAMTNVKQALWAGIGSVLLAASIFRYMGPNREVFNVGRTTVATAGAGAVVMVVVMFGPLGIFEILFNMFRVA